MGGAARRADAKRCHFYELVRLNPALALDSGPRRIELPDSNEITVETNLGRGCRQADSVVKTDVKNPDTCAGLDAPELGVFDLATRATNMSWKVFRQSSSSVSNAYNTRRVFVKSTHFPARECMFRWILAEAASIGRWQREKQLECVKESDTEKRLPLQRLTTERALSTVQR